MMTTLIDDNPRCLSRDEGIDYSAYAPLMANSVSSSPARGKKGSLLSSSVSLSMSSSNSETYVVYVDMIFSYPSMIEELRMRCLRDTIDNRYYARNRDMSYGNLEEDRHRLGWFGSFYVLVVVVVQAQYSSCLQRNFLF